MTAVPPPPRARLGHVWPLRDDGLMWCVVCEAAEGQMPTHCPGKPLTEAQREAIFMRALDFKDGAFSRPCRILETGACRCGLGQCSLGMTL